MASKNQGKTDWAGQRRPVTRRSGFNSTSQLRFRRSIEKALQAGPRNPVVIEFLIPEAKPNQWVGWGGYLFASTGTEIEIDSKRGNTQSEIPKMGIGLNSEDYGLKKKVVRRTHYA